MKKIATLWLLLLTGISNAQMVGPDAYIQGTYMELGIRGLGGFEGVDVLTSPVPAGMHPRPTASNNLFGILGNPQKNGWSDTTYDGDYFTPGSPENGWGFEVGDAGTPVGNNCSYLNNVNGAITSWSHTGSYFSVDWEATTTSGADLHFKINYSMQDSALFYTTTVSVTNIGSTIIPKFYYYRSFDPDNNQDLIGGFTTTNMIERQPDSSYALAHVSATSYTPWKSYIALIGLGEDWRASYGGFSNRDASSLWNGVGFVQTVGATNVADEAIALAYRLVNFLPGATESFAFQTVIDTSSVAAALNGDLFLDFAGENNQSSFIPDTVQVCGGDSVEITVSGVNANAYSWNWSPSAGLSDSVGLSASASPAITTTYTVVGTPLTGTATPDTMLIVVEAYPLFSLTANLPGFGLVCSNAAAFTLTGGAPSGGFYSGPGISGFDLFNPAAAPAGMNIITYTITDSVGCTASDTSQIYVDDVNVTLPLLGAYCNTALPFEITGGSPAGGIYSGPGMVNDSVFDPASLNGYYNITYTYSDSFGCVFSASSGIQINDCTGIDEQLAGNNVLLFPNPFTDQLTVSINMNVRLEDAELVIFDVLGKIVFQTRVHEHEILIHQNDVQKGIYFFRFYNQNAIVNTGKLLRN